MFRLRFSICIQLHLRASQHADTSEFILVNFHKFPTVQRWECLSFHSKSLPWCNQIKSWSNISQTSSSFQRWEKSSWPSAKRRNLTILQPIHSTLCTGALGRGMKRNENAASVAKREKSTTRKCFFSCCCSSIKSSLITSLDSFSSLKRFSSSSRLGRSENNKFIN